MRMAIAGISMPPVMFSDSPLLLSVDIKVLRQLLPKLRLLLRSGDGAQRFVLLHKTHETSVAAR